MPRSKIDSWLMQQAGKPADPDEPANLPVSSDTPTMVTYTAEDGSIQMAFRDFWAAMRSMMPSIQGDFDAVIPKTDTNFNAYDIPSGVRPDDTNDHKMTRMIDLSSTTAATKTIGRILFYRDQGGTPFYLVWETK